MEKTKQKQITDFLINNGVIIVMFILVIVAGLTTQNFFTLNNFGKNRFSLYHLQRVKITPGLNFSFLFYLANQEETAQYHPTKIGSPSPFGYFGYIFTPKASLITFFSLLSVIFNAVG